VTTSGLRLKQIQLQSTKRSNERVGETSERWDESRDAFELEFPLPASISRLREQRAARAAGGLKPVDVRLSMLHENAKETVVQPDLVVIPRSSGSGIDWGLPAPSATQRARAAPLRLEERLAQLVANAQRGEFDDEIPF
jgi:hypothetical protein